jgi:hypothetical protein
MRNRTFVAGAAVGAAVMAAFAALAIAPSASPHAAGDGHAAPRRDRAPQEAQPAATRRDRGAQEAPATAHGPWRDGARRDLSEEDIDKAIATAREVSAEWGDSLEQLRKSDPKALRDRLAREARRLMGLAMMKEREPQLYQVRLEDIRVQNRIHELTETLHAAKKSGDAAAQEAAMKEIEAGVRKQVELDIQARGFELVALDRSLKDARKRLQDDIRDREKTVAELMDSIRAGDEPKFGRRPMGMGARSRGDEDGPPPRPAPSPQDLH